MQVLRRILGLRSTDESNDNVKTAPLRPSSTEVATKRPKDSTQRTVPMEGTVTAPLGPISVHDGRTHQLEPFEGMPMTQVKSSRLLIGHRTDVGQVRDNNQDAYSTFASSISSAEEKPDFGLFVVADGMGGHEDGEKASGLAARIVMRHILKEMYLPLLTDNFSNDASQTPVTEILKQSIQKANESISVQVPDGGTTVTAVAVMGNLAYVAHVGDSRAYLINQDGIEQLTRDHSLVQRLIELGQLTPEEALEHPQRNVLYRAIGQGDVLEVDAITRHIMPGSYLMVCSDGLWNFVSNDELLSITLNHGSNTQLACQTLVDLANERGGTDNISVILVRVPEV
jgi:serine/threonine protein phosphatase PrpC